MATKSRLEQNNGNHNSQNNHQDHGIRDAREDDFRESVTADFDHAEQRVIAKHTKAFRQTGHGPRTGDLQGDTTRDHHHAQGGNERRQLEAGHHKAIEQTTD